MWVGPLQVTIEKDENREKSSGKGMVRRIIRGAEVDLNTNLWGQPVSRWKGEIVFFGEMLTVYGWALRPYVPNTWSDIPDA